MVRWFFAFIFSATLMLHAEIPEVEVMDSRKNYTVVIGLPSSLPANAAGDYVAQKIRETLRREISNISVHRYSDENYREYSSFLQLEEMLSLQRSLSDAYKKRDSAYLSGDRKLVATTMTQIETLKERLVRLTDPDSVQLIIEQEKPVVLKDETEYHDRIPDNQYLVANDIDLYIYISVLTDEEVFGITLRSKDITGDERVEGRGVGTIEQITEELKDAFASIRERIRGGTVYNLVVRTQPDDATIFINDEVEGTGYLSDFYEAGVYSMTVRRPGFSPVDQNITLGTEEVAEFDITLQPYESRRFSIQTVPSNVHVYMDSKPIGTTPLFTTSYDDFHVFQFEREGYSEKKFIFEAGGSMDLNVAMDPEYADIEELFEVRKWNFYRSFGSFILSIPVSLFLAGYSSEYQRYAAPGEPFEYEYAVSTISLYGSIYLNIVLFAQTVVSLFEYVDVGKQAIRGDFVDTRR